MKMTLKDFVYYSTPCFGCERPMDLLAVLRRGTAIYNTIAPQIYEGIFHMELFIQYKNMLYFVILPHPQ